MRNGFVFHSSGGSRGAFSRALTGVSVLRMTALLSRRAARTHPAQRADDVVHRHGAVRVVHAFENDDEIVRARQLVEQAPAAADARAAGARDALGSSARGPAIDVM